MILWLEGYNSDAQSVPAKIEAWFSFRPRSLLWGSPGLESAAQAPSAFVSCSAAHAPLLWSKVGVELVQGLQEEC